MIWVIIISLCHNGKIFIWDERIQLQCVCDSSYEQPDHQAFHYPFDAQGNNISEKPHYVFHKYIQYLLKCHYNEMKENLKPNPKTQNSDVLIAFLNPGR